MNGRRATSIFLMVVVQVMGMAQSGYIPLSRLIEAPTAAAMHRYRSATHTSIRPYLVRDTIGYGSMDSVARFSALPLLDKWAAPAGKWHGGPLLDASFGAPLGDRNATTYRAGAGAWLNVDPTADWSAHADVQYWSETLPDYLDTLFDATHTSLGEGYARGNGPYDHYDWNAYVNYHPAKYFDLTLGRGKQFFGEGYRSLFLSDNATSYPYLRITTTVWHIRYVNLFTQLSDTRGSEGDPSAFKKKYASFHYLSWNASKRFNFAVFEGVVWQSGDSLYPRGFDINYLNPVVLYRPVEYAQGSADNALLGFAINVKVGHRTTLYFQGMLDEFLLSEVRGGNGWFANKQAFQLGAVSYDAFKTKGLMLRSEFNYVRPFMYTHSDTRQNYSHAGQPLAHPYGSNFWEVLVQGQYRWDRFYVSGLMSLALLGSDTGAYSYGNNIFRPEGERPLRDGVRAENYGYYVGDENAITLFTTDLRWGYVVDPRSGLSVEASYLFRTRTTDGSENSMTNWFQIGVSCHLRERDPLQEVRYVLP